MTSFLTVAIVTALCLLVPSLRAYGIIGVGMLLYFRPVITLCVLALAGIIYFIIYRRIA
jgi:hypothetical protein